MKYLFLSTLIVATMAHASNLVPSGDNCNFYLKLELKKLCQQEGADYLVSYGYKYCTHFLVAKRTWNDALERWVSQTALCLQQKIKDYEDLHLEDEDFSCHEMEEIAFNAHASCYRESGFCNLRPFEQLRIVRGLISMDLFFKPRLSLRQALEVAVNCSLDHLRSLERCNLL